MSSPPGATAGSAPAHSTPPTPATLQDSPQTAAFHRIARAVERFAATSAPTSESSADPQSALQLQTAHAEELKALETLHLLELSRIPSGAGATAKREREEASGDAEDVKRVKMEGNDVKPKAEEGDFKPKVEDEAVVLQRQRSLAPTPAPADRPAPPAAENVDPFDQSSRSVVMVPATGQPVAQPPPVPPAKAVVAPPPQPEPPAPAPAPAPVVAAPATRDSDFLKAIDKELASFIKACHNCEEITHDVASIGMSGQGYHNPDLEDADEAEEAMVDGMRKFERRISLFLRNIRKEAKKPVPILHHATNRETFTVLLKGLRAAEHIAMIEEVNEECDIEKLVDAVQEWARRLSASEADRVDRGLAALEPCEGWDECCQQDGLGHYHRIR